MTQSDQVKIKTTKDSAANSLWNDSYIRLKKNRLAIYSFYFICLIILTGILAPLIAPYSFETTHMDDAFKSPGMPYLFGTDGLGRDMLSRLIYGARLSMAVGVITAILSLLFGAIYGGISGWIGGATDGVMMRIVDILYSIPSLVLLILVKVIFDSFHFFENPELRSLVGMLLALSLVGWVTLARVVRGQVLQVKQLTYIEAAQSLGIKGPRILLRHIFPNILGPIIVLLTFQIPSNILAESFLSFIGLGLKPPYSSWGVLASDGWRYMRSYPYLIFFPSLILFLTMLAFNLFGDGLRDAFDPKMKK